MQQPLPAGLIWTAPSSAHGMQYYKAVQAANRALCWVGNPWHCTQSCWSTTGILCSRYNPCFARQRYYTLPTLLYYANSMKCLAQPARHTNSHCPAAEPSTVQQMQLRSYKQCRHGPALQMATQCWALQQQAQADSSLPLLIHAVPHILLVEGV
jgi:hypothetical protein